MAWWATTFQLVGTAIAVGGLLWAYARATRFWDEKWPHFRDRLLKLTYSLGQKRPEVTGTMNTTLKPMDGNLGLQGFAPIVRIRNASLADRLTALEDRLKRLLDQDLPPIQKGMSALKGEITDVRSLAKSEAESALAAARADVAALARDLDRTQTLDLRCAALGLFISGIGTFLQYWA
ncbi:hypothetical protein FZI91_03115 [Mycobacterium sp. CBMA271]|uniref:hypothetical protein n=1 Tax=unclassified Mycobacteroides TaxID=2618759 RepID=UPI0012DF2A2D|nr:MULTISPECIES: hypothetical protein [unclassified Mycobacteroides]MUM16359.1 hypothetical protein [Mycobacteroides sp. CBMA 326]MUM20697.1 hypothetical protein [Mycobacteroides sp. CBMA 271]